jgi:hypothetical protein
MLMYLPGILQRECLSARHRISNAVLTAFRMLCSPHFECCAHRVSNAVLNAFRMLCSPHFECCAHRVSNAVLTAFRMLCSPRFDIGQTNCDSIECVEHHIELAWKLISLT